MDTYYIQYLCIWVDVPRQPHTIQSTYCCQHQPFWNFELVTKQQTSTGHVSTRPFNMDTEDNSLVT